MQRLVIATLLCATLAACGILDSTPDDHITIAGQFDSRGAATIDLPSRAGDPSNLPGLTLYISTVESGPFLLWDAGPLIGLVLISESNDKAHLVVDVAISGAAGWYYRLVVTH